MIKNYDTLCLCDPCAALALKSGEQLQLHLHHRRTVQPYAGCHISNCFSSKFKSSSSMTSFKVMRPCYVSASVPLDEPEIRP